MPKVFFSSDWHIDHKNIHKFRSRFGFSSEQEHRDWIIDCAKSKVNKRDVLYLLGDIAFTELALKVVHSIPCRKVLIKGNHDLIKHPLESQVYDQILGMGRYKGYWITHCPIHPDELRGRKNLHGHTHQHNIDDKQYFNCCVENLVDTFESPVVEFNEIHNFLGDL